MAQLFDNLVQTAAKQLNAGSAATADPGEELYRQMDEWLQQNAGQEEAIKELREKFKKNLAGKGGMAHQEGTAILHWGFQWTEETGGRQHLTPTGLDPPRETGAMPVGSIGATIQSIIVALATDGRHDDDVQSHVPEFDRRILSLLACRVLAMNSAAARRDLICVTLEWRRSLIEPGRGGPTYGIVRLKPDLRDGRCRSSRQPAGGRPASRGCRRRNWSCGAAGRWESAGSRRRSKGRCRSRAAAARQ